MIDNFIINFLKNRKNLLAFSAGVDSSALFFMLLESGVEFNIIFVNYHTRNESQQEENYAKDLAQKYGKKIFIKSAETITNNFEATARSIRYNFFETIIRSNDYNTLITAHQLNDWSEWFLMQFTKGAGFFELAGMRQIEDRSNYHIVRPILNIDRETIENYLKQNSIKYFIDSSNKSRKYLRNRFRDDYISTLMKSYPDGIKRSFEILQNERENLETKAIKRVKNLFIIDCNIVDLYHQIDLAIKQLGYLSSFADRLAIKSCNSIVVGRKITVEKNHQNYFIAPYIKTTIPKQIREQYRVAKIPQKVRGYLYINKIDLLQI